jgi:hypothetical protein
VDPVRNSQLDADYPILVTERNGEYTLRVKELILIVRSRDLGDAYRQIVARRRQLLQWARELGALDELPEPGRRALASALAPPRQGMGTILHKAESAK